MNKYYHMEVSATGRYAYIPAERGRYVRTDFSAVFCACPNKLCQADAGKPCINIRDLKVFDVRVFQAATHKERRAAYQAMKQAERPTDEKGKIVKMRRHA